ncbi:hypothetical protein BN8_04608 [Fibrisoma limi BUZ 3]|uniref:Uncharacterized protein n=1 Tax=Fibrisoma limi BUZ 3 TaxID=1185876 RepID=I2GN76_9BACT|nr:hypothetical protein [Fibrisoma limi]CCH55354.1 hypothetical protein BN8_04608 [Fibrisoma limi BUZ 3]
MKTQLKKAGLDEVRLAATTLILAEGFTTTLCVKDFLRKRNYLAQREHIADWLYAVAKQEGWAVNDNGLFRIFHFPRLKPQLQ